MTENYDTSWDLTPINGISALTKLFSAEKTQKLISNLLIESNKGNLPDDEDAYFTDVAKRSPFRLGHIVEVIGIESEEDDLRGVIVHMKEVKKKGYVPLCDLEVTSKEGRNFWSVREYVVWFANR